MSGPQTNPVMARFVEATLTPLPVIRLGQLRGTERTYLSVTQEAHIQKFEQQLRFRQFQQILQRQFGLGSYSPCLSSTLVCTFALMFRSVYSERWLFLQRARTCTQLQMPFLGLLVRSLLRSRAYTECSTLWRFFACKQTRLTKNMGL